MVSYEVTEVIVVYCWSNICPKGLTERIKYISQEWSLGTSHPRAQFVCNLNVWRQLVTFVQAWYPWILTHSWYTCGRRRIHLSVYVISC